MAWTSKYFSEKEFLRSHTAQKHNIINTWDEPIHRENAIKLCLIMDKWREAINQPLIVTSGYRNKQLNSLVGGAAQSQHLLGKAMDLRPALLKQLRLKAFYNLLNPFWQGGLAINEAANFVHVDIGPNRRWNY